MNYLFNLFLAPFQDFIFMRHALVACMALALGCGPVGVLLVLKRMSLVGDALSHAVLPGVAVVDHLRLQFLLLVQDNRTRLQ